jgi:hypothetical protein
MIYYIETINAVISYYERDTRNYSSIKDYFLVQETIKPKRIAVKGYPFLGMYLTGGTEENGQFIAVKSK